MSDLNWFPFVEISSQSSHLDIMQYFSIVSTYLGHALVGKDSDGTLALLHPIPLTIELIESWSSRARQVHWFLSR